MPKFPAREPIFPDRAQILPGRLPIFPTRAQIFPDDEPIFPGREQIFPDGLPVLPDRLQILPGRLPILPDHLPILPDHLPILPDHLPIFPDHLPILPDWAQIFPDDEQIFPTRAQILPQCRAKMPASNYIDLMLKRLHFYVQTDAQSGQRDPQQSGVKQGESAVVAARTLALPQFREACQTQPRFAAKIDDLGRGGLPSIRCALARARPEREPRRRNREGRGSTEFSRQGRALETTPPGILGRPS